ncbi:hypothetical protein [Bradyrhizobium icense]|uniref:Uncharacterized protein n=1 Tax=Bradyrhizobium icense TaxID=1274631 RepID=A0A1B1UD26_9BRAD|nr:hypothetical protein [Bradyrhizobium icense]ANW00680.1 hypothetical protein LMTR13_11375 [Bradyrhizobium icense]
MSNDLESILSGQQSAAPEPEQEQVTQAAAAEGEGQQEQQQTGATEQEGQQQTRTVPHEALHAEKQKVKRYTEEVAEFRRANETLQRQVSELLQRVPVQKQEAPQAPDFFEDPSAATRHEVRQTVSPQFDQINQTLLAFAKDNAITRFSEEAVNEAESAFISAMQSGKLDQGDYQKVVSSPNRYAAAVQWHKRQIAQAEIGDDPAAFRARLEAELREKILAEQGGQQQAQQRQPVMPSNMAAARNVGARSGPAWGGPSPIQDIFDRSRQTG